MFQVSGLFYSSSEQSPDYKSVICNGASESRSEISSLSRSTLGNVLDKLEQ